MNELKPTMAEQLGQSAMAFQQQRTGHAADGVTVVLSDDTLVIKMDGALSPLEKALAQSPAGAAQVQEFHRALFTTAAGSMRREIKRITGVDVREANTQVEASSGSGGGSGVAHAFTTGAMVQVFLLTHSVPSESWSTSQSSRAGRNVQAKPIRA
jgi:uncharacterized protein YbcI